MTLALPLLTNEHEALRQRARDFVGEHLTPNVEEWEAARDFPRDLFGVVGKAGWFGAKFDPRWGGTGPDLLAEVVWIQELSRCGSGGLAADLGAHSQLASLYVSRQGSDEHRERWLRPSIAGEIVGGLGVTEPGAGSDVNGLRTRAVRDGGDWVINGAKMFITNGSWADYVVVAARTDPDAGHAGVTLFVVEAGTPGFEQRRMKMIGWQTSHTGDLSFTDVRVPDENRLTEEGRGFYAIMQNFAWERLMMSLGSNVASAEALADAVRVANDRGSVRAWSRAFADLAVEIAQADALTEHALRLHVNHEEGAVVDQGELLRATAMSKLVTQRLAVKACNLALDVRGTEATASDHPVRRWLRDARLGPIGGGTDEIMREIVAGTLGL
ncbi:MAG: acyl-CoA dehydrogenase family protein [Nitriliruptorales bacterium]|nr:acyl-CoA dehydrogenase family protein [Nitriliruptorales bacterium]